MAEISFPVVDKPLSENQWKTIGLSMGRGVIDRGGNPYRLTTKDSVANEVTIDLDTITGLNEALLDGFVHRIDTIKKLSVPAVTADTDYEIGLVYDPLQHGTLAGPIVLTVWVAPGDTTSGKSRLVLYRMTRKPNLSLADTPHTEERPRVAPVISVSRLEQLPTKGLVLVDTIGVVRTTGEMRRANIDSTGAITWTQIGASDLVNSATALPTGGTLMKRFDSGVSRVAAPPGTHPDDIVNVGYLEAAIGGTAPAWTKITGKPATFPPSSHNHDGAAITTGTVPHARIGGSNDAYHNTNTGSTWVSVVARDNGQFARYPSALKYKKNVRSWKLDPAVVLGITPVKYEDKENGDTRVGVVADSYVDTLPEMVHSNPATGEVEGWNYMLFGVAQQVAIRHLNDRVKDLEARLAALENGGA